MAHEGWEDGQHLLSPWRSLPLTSGQELGDLRSPPGVQFFLSHSLFCSASLGLSDASLTRVYEHRCLLEGTWTLSYLAVVILTALIYSSSYFSSVCACGTGERV